MHVRTRINPAHLRVPPAASWVEGMARMGYLAKAVLYAAIGVVATRAAIGARSPTGYRGAVLELLKLPVGALLVGAVAAGLLGYSCWRLVRAVTNVERDSVHSRIYSAVTGIVHIAIFFGVAGMLLGNRAGDGDAPAHRWTARALAQPLGRWVVLGAGAGCLIAAIWQLYKTVTAKVDDDLELGRMKRWMRLLTLGAARTGMFARAMIFALIGSSLVRAGLLLDPGSAHGVTGALQQLEKLRFGPVLLFAVAAGFIAYSVYQVVLARYRRVPVP